MFLRNHFSALLSAASSLFSTPDTGEEKQDFRFALNKTEKKQLRDSKSKPKVVALYDENDGASNADRAIQHFENEGIEVVKVPPSEGFNHSFFTKGNNHFNGIYLPGGSDIPVHDDNDPRSKFEGQLVEKARSDDIPLLGICRGEQAIGYHSGLEVRDLSDYDQHYYHNETAKKNPDLNNTVVVDQGSQLYDALQHEFKSGKKDKPIEYSVSCLHHQHVPDTSSKKNIGVTARNKFDGTIEAIEIPTGNYYTIGLQHHPEVVIDSFESKRNAKIAEAQNELNESLLEAHFIDPEIHIGMAYSRAMSKRHAACKKSKDERAARAELGLFTSQVKKQFLEKNESEKKKDSNQRQGFLPRFW
jgi:gamma-glutamyl-gamma-aminobutyrate hydrolase PuuD